MIGICEVEKSYRVADHVAAAMMDVNCIVGYRNWINSDQLRMLRTRIRECLGNSVFRHRKRVALMLLSACGHTDCDIILRYLNEVRHLVSRECPVIIAR